LVSAALSEEVEDKEYWDEFMEEGSIVVLKATNP
jgi:hypothetical protein